MKKVLALVILMLAVAAGGVYLWLRADLPCYTKTISVKGLSGPVSIERNRFAMPTITAQNRPDLFLPGAM